MNDVDEMLAAANPVPEAPGATPEQVRAVVQQAMFGTDSARTPVRRVTPRRLLAVAAVVAAVAIGLGVLPRDGGGAGPAASADPAAVLRVAASYQLEQASRVVPRGDQFLYVQDGGYQAWLSMDGLHDGLVDDGTKTPVPGCHSAECVPTPAYLPDVPTTPEALKAWLVARNGSGTNQLGKGVGALLTFNYLLPDARAALFTAISTLPGLSAVRIGDDLGVTWDFGGGSTTLVFTADTHDYLGTRTVSPGGDVGGDLMVRTAVVDRVGEVPAGFPPIVRSSSDPAPTSTR